MLSFPRGLYSSRKLINANLTKFVPIQRRKLVTTTTTNSRKAFPRYKGLIFTGIIGLICYDTLVNEDDSKILFYSCALTRCFRVASGIVLATSDYYKTLNAKYDSEEEYTDALSACHLRTALCARRVFEGNGGIYLKLGQHISALAHLVPPEWVTVMRNCQDQCPPSSIKEIEKLFLQDTGSSLDELFSEFDLNAIGVASLAQVHRAQLKDSGQEVAVKIQHPSLRKYVPIDILICRHSFQFIHWVFPEFALMWLSDEMERSLPQELDFRREALNSIKTRNHFLEMKGSPLYVPQIFQASERLLIMEFVHGNRLDDIEYMKKMRFSREQVSLEVARVFHEMIFGPLRHLHCDPHGGNVMIRPRPATNSNSKFPFEIVLLDHGLYRTLPKDFQVQYAELWLCIINQDEANLKKIAQKIACVNEHDASLFVSIITGREYQAALTSLMRTRTDDEISSIRKSMVIDSLIADIVRVLASLPRHLLLVLKTNDLTRALCENLQAEAALASIYIDMARYCEQVEFKNQLEQVKTKHLSSLEKYKTYFNCIFNHYLLATKFTLWQWWSMAELWYNSANSMIYKCRMHL